jgi:hypothetical protein
VPRPPLPLRKQAAWKPLAFPSKPICKATGAANDEEQTCGKS